MSRKVRLCECKCSPVTVTVNYNCYGVRSSGGEMELTTKRSVTFPHPPNGHSRSTNKSQPYCMISWRRLGAIFSCHILAYHTETFCCKLLMLRMICGAEIDCFVVIACLIGECLPNPSISCMPVVPLACRRRCVHDHSKHCFPFCSLRKAPYMLHCTVRPFQLPFTR